ncbi:MAG: KEOPS complex subunit Pcc1 [Candidatus Thorarchaeota archaeon]
MELELQSAPSDVAVQSLAPDNILPAGPLHIRLSGEENKLHVEITGCKRIETLLATIEDILQAVQVVEKTAETKNQHNRS